MLDRLVRKVALRFVPADFVPQTQSTRAAESERALAGWAALHRRRDDIVREAFDAGVPKTRIHELTGLSRSTIDRLLRREGSDQTC
ncbi:hypothetical protein ACFW9F_16990, partial [Streptomyces sp. NPDC059506]|uniref:hypothetical protein n=1 Tax=Streptomyces sp. NPDC059506 TaxID=3347751 RepID=UPI0036771377